MSRRWQPRPNRSWGQFCGRKRPPGLQGKAIGLYYRDLNIKKNKRDRESVIALKIPQAVMSKVVLNIQAIEKFAAEQNIPITKSEPFIRQLESTSNIKIEDSSDALINVMKNEEPNASTSTCQDQKPELFKVPNTKPSEATDDFIPLFSNENPTKSQKIPIKELSKTIQTRKIDDKYMLSQSFEKKVNTETEYFIDTQGSTSDVELEDSKSSLVITKHDETSSLNDCKVEEPNASTSKCQDYESGLFKVPNTKYPKATDDYIKVGSYTLEPLDTLPERQLSLRGGAYYKYSYKDIISGTFEEKLNESIAKGVSICAQNQKNDDLNLALHEEYKDMVTRHNYKDMMKFREKLPTYKKSAELLNVISNNQVIVISGETGCGKSTQVPQIILDDAICNNKGAYTHILVTQPRRIAASSLAARVAQERAERLGNSVGYAVRLEKTDSRPCGSIMYVTTGILLADLEVNQGLTNYSHIILDEAHERDCHMDFSMCMLKQVLAQRKDLKLILMSATLDSERLSAYFDDCPAIHIEGLAYPVKDIYLEEILEMTQYKLPDPDNSKQSGNHGKGPRKWKKKQMRATQMENDVNYRAEMAPWLESVKKNLSRDVYLTLQDSRIEDMNIDLIVELLIHICKGPMGAILVFLPGMGEISKVMRMMEESGAFPNSRYEIYPLHSKLPTLDQRRIFDRPPPHIRKIIIATNIAETSITVDDIVYVVDCGKIKITGLNVNANISTLSTQFVSKANLMQRRGRAGRCQPGVAYHLLTSHRAETLPDRLLPELQRSNLLEPVLMIKKLRLGRAAAALQLVPDPPAEYTIGRAVKHLQQCGALDAEEKLTPLGWHLARLPVHPAAGKLLLFGALFGCVDRAASVAAVWGFKDPFNIVFGKEREVEECKRYLALGEPSDHVAISEAIIQWERVGRHRQGQFAYEHFLSNNTLHLLSEMKQQLFDNLGQMGFLTSRDVRSSWENRNANNLCIFRTIVAASLYPNIATVRWTNSRNPRRPKRISRVQTPEDGKVSLHPSSVMCARHHGPQVSGLRAWRHDLYQLGLNSISPCDSPGANWLVYWLKQKSTNLFLFEVTLVYTLPLLFFGELVVSKVEDEPEDCLISVSSVKVQCRRETAQVLFQLRALLDQVLASMVTASGDRSARHSRFDELILKAVTDLITAEDEKLEGLTDDSDADSERDDSSAYSHTSYAWQ